MQFSVTRTDHSVLTCEGLSGLDMGEASKLAIEGFKSG